MINAQATTIAKTILSHLKANGQLGLISDIVEIIKNSSEYKNSHHHVVVTSAIALSPKETKSLKLYLDKKIGKSYSLEGVIDPSLLAGFTLQINDTFIDASVLGKINLVSNKLSTKEL